MDSCFTKNAGGRIFRKWENFRCCVTKNAGARIFRKWENLGCCVTKNAGECIFRNWANFGCNSTKWQDMALKVCDDVDDNKTKLSAKERAEKDFWSSSNDQLKTMEWTKGFWKDSGLNGGVPPLFST